MENVGALRNHASIAHGTSASSQPLTLSQARAAVNSAGVLANFLMDAALPNGLAGAAKTTKPYTQKSALRLKPESAQGNYTMEGIKARLTQWLFTRQRRKHSQTKMGGNASKHPVENLGMDRKLTEPRRPDAVLPR